MLYYVLNILGFIFFFGAIGIYIKLAVDDFNGKEITVRQFIKKGICMFALSAGCITLDNIAMMIK